MGGSNAAAVTSFVPQFQEPSGKNPTPLKKVVMFLSMPSQALVPGKGHLAQHKKGGSSPPPPPAHSQICLLAPLLISQTTKEVWYQELQAHCHSTTVDCVKYIINMKYATCSMQREATAGWAGLESMFIDWKTPSPDPGLAIQCASAIN